VILLVVAACGDAGQPPLPQTSEQTFATTAAEPTPVTEEPPTVETTDMLLDAPSTAQQATVDLATRLGVATADIDVVVTEPVTWRNGSLGCPEPGMRYTQALVDGIRVILEVDGRRYAYHSRRGQAPFFCADPADNGATPGT
jgi:hypothetical protein